MSEAICIKELSFSYPGSEPLFEKINLDITEGEKWAVIGPNGSGKSTLVRLMLGLLKPTSGSISVFGKSPQDNSNTFGYVPQNLELPTGFPISTREFVLAGLVSSKSMFGLFNKRDRTRVSKMLDVFELEEFGDTTVGSLSGGNLQKALLARAFVNEPKVLVIDEALSNIDPRKENEVLDRLQSIQPNLTIIVVTHDMGMVSHHIEKVACLNKNLVVHKTEALNDAVLKEVFGGQVRVISHKHSESVDHKH